MFPNIEARKLGRTHRSVVARCIVVPFWLLFQKEVSNTGCHHPSERPRLALATSISLARLAFSLLLSSTKSTKPPIETRKNNPPNIAITRNNSDCDIGASFTSEGYPTWSAEFILALVGLTSASLILGCAEFSLRARYQSLPTIHGSRLTVHEISNTQARPRKKRRTGREEDRPAGGIGEEG